VAVSAINHCHYCLTSHGAVLRQRAADPELGETVAQNYRAANLDRRQKAMLDFAAKLTETPDKIEEADRAALRRAGFSDRDIWDIAAVASFYNMSNRMASATDMRPNPEYHYWARDRAEPPAPASRRRAGGTARPLPAAGRGAANRRRQAVRS
jgi:uncharacterized peroxidase-related enzyme